MTHSAIDWSRPWLDAVRPAFKRLAPGELLPALNAAAAQLGLCNHAGLPLRFIPQDELPPGVAYEAHIAASGCVPTRDNLHDYFNALVWLTFPRIKQQLNALQAAQIALDGVGKSRGAARDGATIFDENAALLVVMDDEAGHALVDALHGHEWQRALLGMRSMWGPQAQAWLFGHALMEKLAAPRKGITAHVRVLWADAGFFAATFDEQRDWIDRTVAAQLAKEGISTACFSPLQALGVPGWWEGQDEAFYADASVFRPKRASSGAPR